MSVDSGGDHVRDTKQQQQQQQQQQRLLRAVQNGNEERVIDLLDSIGWNLVHSVSFPFLRDESDTGTLLHVACVYGRPRLVKLFLERNANPDKKSRVDRVRPLHLGAQRGYLEICQLLISSGCKVDATDAERTTALHRASLRGRDGVVKLLLKHRAEINRGDNTGWRPLHSACLMGNASTVQLLVDSGAGVDCCDSDGETPLHFASAKGLPGIVKLLVRLGANVNIANGDKHTALCHAVTKGHLQTARTLIADLQDPSSVTHTLRFHLHLALEHRSIALLGFVCAHGALETANQKLKSGAIQFATENASRDQCPPRAPPLAVADDVSFLNACLKAMEEGELHLVIVLAAAGALTSAGDEIIAKFLWFAVSKGSVELALLLLKTNKRPNLDKNLRRGVLELAEREMSVELAQKLTACCEDFAEGETSVGHDAVLGLLLRKGAATQFLLALCQTAFLTGVRAQMVRSVLTFAVENESAELTLLACQSNCLAKEDIPDLLRTQTVELLRHRAAAEMVKGVRYRGYDFNTASQKMVVDILQVGLKLESIELVLAVASEATALSSAASEMHASLPRRFVEWMVSADLSLYEHGSEPLVRAGTDTAGRVLALALKKESVELALIACRADALSSEDAPDLVHAAVQLALQTASMELAAAVCQRCKPDAIDPKMAADMLHLGLESESAGLVLSVVSKTEALATASSEALAKLLKFAVKHSSAELAVLVCKAGAATLADSELLRRALEMGVATCSGELLCCLSKAGALRSSSNDLKEKVLHQAAIMGDLQLADHCISSGAFHQADQWPKPTPVDIATQRGHSRLAEKLKRALDNHKLLSLGQRDASTVLIRVAGPPGAGKSTLVKSLRTTRLRGFFRQESQPDEEDRNFRTRTRGIQVYSYEDSNGTLCRVLDLGGQEDFAVANQLFIGEGQISIINIITVSSLKHYLEIEKEVLKWSSFFASRKDNSALGKETSLQPIIVVATRSESADSSQMENVEKAVDQAKASFGKFLDFQQGPKFVDARTSWTAGMRKLRNLLAGAAKMVLQRAPPQAALCNDIQRALPWIRAKVKRPIISRRELPELVARGLSSWRRTFDKSVIESHADLLDAALRQMSDACEILSFETPELKDVLVIHPPWLLHQVVGVFLSPANFPPPRVLYDKDGQAQRVQAEMALEVNFGQVLGKGATLQMVAQLGLCILDENQHGKERDEKLVVPSKLETRRNLQGILSAGTLAMIWFGIELVCSEVPLSVCLFPQLQVHLFNYLQKRCKQRPIMWSGGIAVALSHEQVVGIVEARHGRMAIDIMVQGTEASRRTCFCMLQTLKEQTLLKVQSFSPGSDVTEKVLSSRELSSLDWSQSHHVPRVTYERAYAEEAIEHGQIRPYHEDESLCVLEDAFNLMAIPPTHVSLMTPSGYKRFCHEINWPPSSGEKSVKWQELARRLGMPRHEMPLAEYRVTPAANPTDIVLQWWFRRSGRHTIDRLLSTIRDFVHPEAAAILKEELAFSLNILPEKPEPSEAIGLDLTGDSPVDVPDSGIAPQISLSIHDQEHCSSPDEASASALESTRWSILRKQTGSPPSQTHSQLLPSSVKKHAAAHHACDIEVSYSPASDEVDFWPPEPVTQHSPLPACAEVMAHSEPTLILEHTLSAPTALIDSSWLHSPVADQTVFTRRQHVPAASHGTSPDASISEHSPVQDTPTRERHSSAPAVREERCDWPADGDERLVATSEASQPASKSEIPQPAHGRQEIQRPVTVDTQISEECDGDSDTNFERQLFQVANTFYNMFECKQLAVYLNISRGGRIVSTLQSTNPAMQVAEIRAAYKILMTWKNEKGRAATVGMLCRVLRGKLKKVHAVELVWPGLLSTVSCNDGSSPPVTSGMLDTCPETGPEGTVPETVVMDIALNVHDLYSCQKLAACLKISQGFQFVDNLNPHATNCERAYDVMMEWKKEKGSAATGEWLYDVLHNQLDRKDLALQFEEVFLRKPHENDVDRR